MQIVQASLDLSRMDNLLEDIQHALIGTGQDEDADARKLIRQEAKLLAWECARKVGPLNERRAERRIKSDLRQVFHPMADRSGAEWKTFKDAKAGGSEGIRWLYAGPTYLVGVRNDDYMPNAADAKIESIYNQRGRGNMPGSIAWQDKGQHIRYTNRYEPSHGKQHAFILNRIVIKAARFNALLKKLAGRIGRMRATFAYAADQLGMKDIPEWISRHFPSVAAEGKAVFDDSAMNNPKRPSILFGSRAPGIAHFQDRIQSAINTRAYKMKEHLRLILNGYAKDHKAGRSIKRRAQITSFAE